MKKILIRTSLVLLLILGMAANAAALPMTGGISFAGDYALPLGTTLATANSFLNFTNVKVQSGTGTWLGVTQNTVATFNGFQFNPALAVTPLWTFAFGGITYSLDALASTMTFQRSSSGGDLLKLDVQGSGMIHGTGFTDTLGYWNITANSGGGTFSFSSSNSAVVPEPLTLILLGSGLLGLAGLRRKLSNEQHNARKYTRRGRARNGPAFYYFMINDYRLKSSMQSQITALSISGSNSQN